MGNNIKETDPITRKNGNISSPNKMPKRDKTGPVIKNCITIELAPDTA